jgi:hypothetical protein
VNQWHVNGMVYGMQIGFFLKFLYGYIADILCVISFWERRDLSDSFMIMGIAYLVSMIISYILLYYDVVEARRILAGRQVCESFINLSVFFLPMLMISTINAVMMLVLVLLVADLSIFNCS